MKFAIPILFIWLFIIAFSSCASAEKAANERQNFMMPKTSEIKRNSAKFDPAKDNKSYQKKVKKKRKKKKNKRRY